MNEYLKLAQALIRAVKTDDTEAVRRMHAHLPPGRRFCLTHAKYVIARESGCANWGALRERVKGEKDGQ